MSRELLRIAQRAVPRARGGIHLLAYHLVEGGTGSPVDLGEDLFRRQMEELREELPVISLDAAIEELEGGAPLRELTVVLTFDDAYRNFRQRAWPVLEALELPVTLFVPTGFVAGDEPGPLREARELPPLAWDELRELASSDLVTVGSHTVRHRDLPALPAEEAVRELVDSKRILEERLGLEIRHFAYPRGRWTREIDRRAREIYRSTAVAGGRVNRRFEGRLYRIPVRRDGPESVLPRIERVVWLEEWAADLWRRFGFGRSPPSR